MGDVKLRARDYSKYTDMQLIAMMQILKIELQGNYNPRHERERLRIEELRHKVDLIYHEQHRRIARPTVK